MTLESKVKVTYTLHYELEGIHSWHNHCLWYVDDNDVSDLRYNFEVKGKGQI